MSTSDEAVLSLTQPMDGSACYEVAKERLCVARKDELDSIFALLTRSESKRAYAALKSIVLEYADELEHDKDRRKHFTTRFEVEMKPWARRRDRRSKPLEFPPAAAARIAEHGLQLQSD